MSPVKKHQHLFDLKQSWSHPDQEYIWFRGYGTHGSGVVLLELYMVGVGVRTNTQTQQTNKQANTGLIMIITIFNNILAWVV